MKNIFLVIFCQLTKFYCQVAFTSWYIGQFVSNKAKGRISKRVFQKRSTLNVPKNKHFLPHDTHTYVCVSGGKRYSFFGKFGVLCFLETPVLRFALLPYYRRICVLQLSVNQIVTLKNLKSTVAF